MMKDLCSVLIVFFDLLLVLQGKRNFDIYQRQCNVKAANKCCQTNCTITNPNSSLPLLTFHFTTNEDIPNVYGNVFVTIKRPKQNPFTLLNISKINLCQLADGSNGIALARRFIGELLKYGNFPKGCPLRKGHYFVDRLVLNPDILPDYVRNLTFQSRLIVFTVGKDGVAKNLISVQYDGEVIKRGGKIFVGKLF